MSDLNTPTFASVFAAQLAAHSDQLFTSFAGRIIEYNATDRSAVVQPVGLRSYEDESGKRKTEPYPTIPGVPVLFQGGNGGGMTFPLIPGDGVLIVFLKGSIDQWLALDGDPDPRNDRAHDYSDAVAVPGLMSFKNATPADDTHLVITEPTGGEIHVGGSSPFAMKADLDALASYITGHVHPAPGGTTSAPTGPVPSAAGSLIAKGS